MKLVTGAELGIADWILSSNTAPNTLYVCDPDRFPELVPMVAALLERELPNGHVYAYLAHRFAGHPHCINWYLYSLGAAGDRARQMLETVDRMMKAPIWVRAAEKLEGPWPLRERIFIAWLEGRLPEDILVHAPPVSGRTFGVSADTRRMLRGRRS